MNTLYLPISQVIWETFNNDVKYVPLWSISWGDCVFSGIFVLTAGQMEGRNLLSLALPPEVDPAFLNTGLPTLQEHKRLFLFGLVCVKSWVAFHLFTLHLFPPPPQQFSIFHYKPYRSLCISLRVYPSLLHMVSMFLHTPIRDLLHVRQSRDTGNTGPKYGAWGFDMLHFYTI